MPNNRSSHQHQDPRRFDEGSRHFLHARSKSDDDMQHRMEHGGSHTSPYGDDQMNSDSRNHDQSRNDRDNQQQSGSRTSAYGNEQSSMSDRYRSDNDRSGRRDNDRDNDGDRSGSYGASRGGSSMGNSGRSGSQRSDMSDNDAFGGYDRDMTGGSFSHRDDDYASGSSYSSGNQRGDGNRSRNNDDDSNRGRGDGGVRAQRQNSRDDADEHRDNYGSGQGFNQSGGGAHNYGSGQSGYGGSGMSFGVGSDSYGAERSDTSSQAGRGSWQGPQRPSSQSNQSQNRGQQAGQGGNLQSHDQGRQWGNGGSNQQSRDQGQQWGQGGNQQQSGQGQQSDRFSAFRGGSSDMAGSMQQGQHKGRGPKGYRRGDERITDDVNEALTHDEHLDASEIEVKVANGEVTLTGTVDSREAKRHAEDIVERVSGVSEVHNQVRVNRPGQSAPAKLSPPAMGDTSKGASATDSQHSDAPSMSAGAGGATNSQGALGKSPTPNATAGSNAGAKSGDKAEKGNS